MKKEYLKNNFIKPLSESFTINNQELFSNTKLEENRNLNGGEDIFANYIKFDLSLISDDFIERTSQHSNKGGTQVEISNINSNIDSNYKQCNI
jgi:hypothetical protein